MKRLGAFIFTMFYCLAAFAEDSKTLREPVEQNFRLYYRLSDIVIDRTYLDNELQMDTITRYLARSPKIDSIIIYAYASPEGSFLGNKRLAEKRAEAAKAYILANLGPEAGTPEIIMKPVPEHWGGLYREVEANYHRHDREKVLKILKAEGIGDETRKWRLQQLDNGYTWHLLIRKHMPRLRTAEWKCHWVPPVEIEPLQKLTAQAVKKEKEEITRDTTIRRPAAPAKNYIPALKTNLLYDAATALNVSAEFPVGRNFSIMVEDVFPWWNWGTHGNKYCFQLWEMGIEPRWWFKSNGNLQGHFLGIYGKSAKYDFQNDTRFCYQGEYWSTGVSYGYAMKIGSWLQMEFSLSLGYLQSDYRNYQPSPDYEHLYINKYKTGTFSYFGPTKAQVSLVFPIRFGPKTDK